MPTIVLPAALIWARGLENRTARITFDQPAGKSWKVATQLHPTDDPATFTAANLQYLMDSPTEFSDFSLRAFRVELPGAGPGAAGGSRVATRRTRIGRQLSIPTRNNEPIADRLPNLTFLNQAPSSAGPTKVGLTQSRQGAKPGSLFAPLRLCVTTPGNTLPRCRS